MGDVSFREWISRTKITILSHAGSVDFEPANCPESGNKTQAEHVYDEVFQEFDALSKKTQDSKPSKASQDNGRIVKDEFGTVIRNLSSNQISLDRERKFSSRFSIAEDGSRSYEYTDMTGPGNFKSVVKPDGKGGYFIHWNDTPGDDDLKAKNNVINVDYHWQPNEQEGNKPARVGQPGNKKPEALPANDADRETPATEIFNDGKGSQILCRKIEEKDESGKIKFSIPEYDLTSIDGMQSKISFRENGEVVIKNKNNNSVQFIPLGGGYSITSLNPRGEVLGTESVVNGEKTVFNGKDDLTVTNKRDGTVDTVKANEDGTFSRWLTYKEGGFCYEHLDLKGDKNYVQDSKDVRIKADKEQGRMEETYGAKLSKNAAPGDPPFTFQGKPFTLRRPVLKELQAIEKVLEKCPLDKSKGKLLNITMLNGTDFPIKGVGAGYRDGNIVFSPMAFRQNYLQDPDIVYGANLISDSFEGLGTHEVSHALAERRNPKYRDPESPESIEQGRQYGFKRIDDPTKNEDGTPKKRQWVIECEEQNADKKEIVYYKALNGVSNDSEKSRWARVDLSGKFLDSSGNIVDIVDKASTIDFNKLREIAKVKLPTPYAYANPHEADAEVLTCLRINERSRENLLLSDEKIYDFAVLEDQGDIDREKPADKDGPQGYMRIPSGKIVARTKANEELVAEFKRRINGDRPQ